MKYLYTEKNPRSGLRDINNVYISTYEQLNKETDSFFETYEKVKAETEKMEEANLDKRKADIIKQLRKKVEIENKID
jgi:hypothetical protein